MKSLSIIIFLALLVACTSAKPTLEATHALAASDAAPSAARCSALANTRLDIGVVDSAEAMAEGAQMIGFFKRTLFRFFVGKLPDLRAADDFCRVTVKLKAEQDSEITAEYWLPMRWNNKLLGIGGGGFNGGLSGASLMLLPSLKKGYLGMATDAGHDEVDSAKFAYESESQYLDYAYRANHVATQFAKKLAAAYYDKPVEKSYFHGCSNGGRDALMLAKRFPDDYDGIIAGAPAAGWSKMMALFAWNAQAVASAPDLEDKLAVVQSAVLDKCDALDGIRDQRLENPSDCSFDPAEIQCGSDKGSDCLTAVEVDALRKIYSGPKLKDGTSVYAGMPVGGEALDSNWTLWITGNSSMQSMFAKEAFRWLVYEDENWDIEAFNIDSDYLKARELVAPVMDSDDPDLRAFLGGGGKLLLYHGWNDAAIPAGATVEYYESLRKVSGRLADDNARLFMLPGVKHCGGGVGPTDYDFIEAMEQWEQSGSAPTRIIATEYDPPAVFGPAVGAKVVRTRPLCPWPETAHYSGSGSMDAESSFICK